MLAALLLGLAACVDQSKYLEIAGGGFLFNYRNAEATYGIVLVPRRDPPAGAVIEASFQDPAGGPPFLVSRPARGGGRIELQSPPLKGVKKGVPYHVTVLLKAADGSEIVKLEKDFTSDLDQSVLPDKPLAIGPGYQANIHGSTSPFPPQINLHAPAGVPVGQPAGAGTGAK